MAPFTSYVREVRASVDTAAFFFATALCALSFWFALTVNLTNLVPAAAFAILLLPFFMLLSAIPVALIAVTWASVRHRMGPFQFSAGWFVATAVGVSILQRLAPPAFGNGGYEFQELASAAALWSTVLAASAFLYAKMSGAKSLYGATTSEA